VLTGSGEERDRWRSVEAVIDLHQHKPADPTLLLGVLERFSRGGERLADGECG
jgi:hypothetical protein